ncbi:MAG: MoxR family ATPase [Chitinophagaceae bacterium]|nr:MoxR family ATPase [Chitinophagaceae bacterium]
MDEEIFKTDEDIQKLNGQLGTIKSEIDKVIVGQDKMVELMLIGLLCEGHVLIEGVPGVAKTLAAKLMARTIQTGFSRIQFTPDLMPADVLGSSVFNPETASFEYKRGPIFSNVILIDEINRAPAKTQSALFEVMEERQVTMDGNTYPMEFPFIVLATQNPIEQEGTYRLPEAQLDRFLFKIIVDYPTREEEVKILLSQQSESSSELLNKVQAVITNEDLLNFRRSINKVRIDPQLVSYIADIVQTTRNSANLFLGASPRASLALLRASKASAAIRGRNFVSPDDIKEMALPVLRHRLIRTPEKEMEGVSEDVIINQILSELEVPR